MHGDGVHKALYHNCEIYGPWVKVTEPCAGLI